MCEPRHEWLHVFRPCEQRDGSHLGKKKRISMECGNAMARTIFTSNETVKIQFADEMKTLDSPRNNGIDKIKLNLALIEAN